MEEQTPGITQPNETPAIVVLQMQSHDIGELAEALAKAQGCMEPATKDATNPFFKSQYASLASCWQACRGPLSKHGLAVIQTTETVNGDVTVISMLAHSSGQWIKGKLSVKPPKTDSQSLGSCLSYLRRYSLSALVGLSTQDDDAESTMTRNPPAGPKAAQKTTPKVDPEPSDIQKFLEAVTALTEEKGMSGEIFDAFMSEQGFKRLEEIKTKTTQVAFYNALKKA